MYASKTDGHMKKADHPVALLHGSLVSSSIGKRSIVGTHYGAFTIILCVKLRGIAIICMSL